MPTVLNKNTPDQDVPSIVPIRNYFRWIGLGVVVILAFSLISSFVNAPMEYSVIPEYLFSPIILNGVVNTIVLTITCMVLAIILGVIFALMAQSSSVGLRTAARAYTWFFRAVPVLVQLLIWFNLAIIFPVISVPGLFSVSTNHVITPFLAAVLGLGIAEGAYMAEIVRSGLLSVGSGQREAAQAIGLTKSQTIRRIVLPQALRIIIPPTGNQAIGMLKYTSLAYTVGFAELLKSASVIYQTNLLVIELLFVASIWYLFLTTIMMIGQHFLEQRFGRGFAAKGTNVRTQNEGK